MADCPMFEITLNLPQETVDLLMAYAKVRNSPLENAASAAIRDGIEATMVLHPEFRERMGYPEPHPMSIARRLAYRNPQT